MKTGWKWRFVAHVGLALLLTLQVLFVIATLIWIFPKVEYGQAMFEEQFPDYFRFRSTWGYLWGAYNTWFIWLPIIIVGWAVFEWKCHSENKSTIRLAVGAWASFAMMVVIFLVSAVLMLSLSMLIWTAKDMHPEPIVWRNAERASAAYARLEQAVESEDWEDAHTYSRELVGAARSLRKMGSAAPALAAMHDRAAVDDIRSLLTGLAEYSDDVRDRIRDEDSRDTLTPHEFEQLRQLYEQLRSRVKGWPAADE